MSDKLKEFTNFIKQDFDIVEDYKNASKELTAKEAFEIAIEPTSEEYIRTEVRRRNKAIDITRKALTKLDELKEEVTRIIRNAENKIIENNKERNLLINPLDRVQLLGENTQLANTIVNLRVALRSGDNE